jgi:hypothetical protein
MLYQKKKYIRFFFLLVEYIKFKYKFNILKNKNDESVNKFTNIQINSIK